MFKNKLRDSINKCYSKIDKIAKKGRDSYLEYYEFIDSSVAVGEYGIFQQTVFFKYGIDIANMAIPDVKKHTWKVVLFNTTSEYQDGKYQILKDNNVYQVGLNYYLELPSTSAKIIDTSGTASILDPIVNQGGITSIYVINPGYSYSASASVVFTGGLSQASGYPIVRAGKIYDVIISSSGSHYNSGLELGQI